MALIGLLFMKLGIYVIPLGERSATEITAAMEL
jgi:hypothetical protein